MKSSQLLPLLSTLSISNTSFFLSATTRANSGFRLGSLCFHTFSLRIGTSQFDDQKESVEMVCTCFTACVCMSCICLYFCSRYPLCVSVCFTYFGRVNID